LGGETTRANLWLACRPCNEYKGTQTQADDPETGKTVSLFHPRKQVWSEHFCWSGDGWENTDRASYCYCVAT